MTLDHGNKKTSLHLYPANTYDNMNPLGPVEPPRVRRLQLQHVLLAFGTDRTMCFVLCWGSLITQVFIKGNRNRRSHQVHHLTEVD